MNLSSGHDYAFNNTLLATSPINASTAFQAGGSAYGAGAGNMEFENNALSTADQLMSICNSTTVVDGCSGAASSVFAAGYPDYNVYAAGGGDSFVCSTPTAYNSFPFSAFSSWKSCIGADSHSTTTSSLGLNANGSPASGSPVINAGANLTSLCTGALVPLCSDIAGNPRPTTGPWDAGAYQ
jgi:hypothetical protein